MESHNKNIYAAYKASIASTEHSNPDELRHWKYIKREWKNGKYRYYYKDTGFDDVKIERQRAKDNYERAKEHSNAIRDFVTYYTFQLDEKNGGDKLATDRNKNLQGWKKSQEKAADELAIAAQKYRSIDKTYQRAVKAYNSSAGHKVADFLENSEDKIRKAAEWVKHIFN